MVPTDSKHLQTEGYCSAEEAAERLGVSAQRVRDLIREAALDGKKDASGRWRIKVASVDRRLQSRGSKKPKPTMALEQRVRALEDGFRELQAIHPSGDIIQSLERERDRFRADAAAAREAALRINAASEDLEESFRRSLKVIGEQREALVQLLGPGSPADLGPASH